MHKERWPSREIRGKWGGGLTAEWERGASVQGREGGGEMGDRSHLGGLMK